MKLEVSAFTVPPDESYPLYVSAKRYTSAASNQSEEGANELAVRTLVFLHSTGFHKEVWEPTVEDLYKMLSARFSSTPRARIETWVIECPNHGQSAILNDKVLQSSDFQNCFSCEKYAVAAHRFITLGPLSRQSVKGLIGIGHSLGGVSLCFLQGLRPNINFETMILVEPMLNPLGMDVLEPLRTWLVNVAYERRDSWPDRQQAYRDLEKRSVERGWDPRVTDLYVKYALRTHPTAQCSVAPYKGITLCLPKDGEVAMYRDRSSPLDAMPFLEKACQSFPVHVILGEQNDYIPRTVSDALISPPRRFASVSRISEAGHLVPHQAPTALAATIVNILWRNGDKGLTKL